MGNRKHAVITGSSSGIGYGLAEEFLKVGYTVTVSGRNKNKLHNAEKSLIEKFSADRLISVVCDVRDPNQISNLWSISCEKFGRTDIWINNAGIGQDYEFAYNINEEKINDIIDINIKGVIYSTCIVYNKMSEQGFGALYNMEGFGSDGRKMAKLSLYGMTKSSVTYFTRSFIKEIKQNKIIVGLISPGMVITDLFLKPEYKNEYEAKRFLKIANILADKVGTVTPWLVRKIIANKKQAPSIKWLSNLKLVVRFIKSLIVKRKLITFSDIK